MQLNLPPPPLIHITFSGQPAVSTGVVNLAALLGSTDFLLVRHVPPTEGADVYDTYDENDSVINGSQYDADKNEINNNKKKHTNVNDSDGVNGNSNPIDGFVSQRRKLQLCDHAGLPLGCFAVEGGGRYEVVRRSDIHVGVGISLNTREKKKRKRNTREEEGEEEEKQIKEQEGEKEEEEEYPLSAEEKRRKKKREKRRQWAEKMKEVGADRGENRSVPLRSRSGNEKTTTTVREEENEKEEEKEEERNITEKVLSEEGVQRVSLDTPLTDSPTDSQQPLEQSEQKQQEEEEKKEKEKAKDEGKTLSRPPPTQEPHSPSLADSPLPVKEVRRRRRPLNQVSSSSSTERKQVQYTNGNQQEGEKEQHSGKEPLSAEKKHKNNKNNNKEHNSHAEENTNVVEKHKVNKSSNLRNSAGSSTTDDETFITRAVKNTAVEKGLRDGRSSSSSSSSSSSGSKGRRRKSNKNHDDHDSLLDVLKKNTTPTITATAATGREREITPIREEGREEELWSEVPSQQRPSANGWMPLESPALGFTSVDNTLSQDFSLDSSSATSSADQMF
ncbi:hypothetical protein LSM04_001335 [Trypanosoma melophagium]|uniref:uncharacterized protein n=1 Tax=Trypanosoma melophagium TaxID=715481 RepID=UPI00351A2262|nr:hypothetical protein LSM04_001335 [Trypanosoma melophagium]